MQQSFQQAAPSPPAVAPPTLKSTSTKASPQLNTAAIAGVAVLGGTLLLLAELENVLELIGIAWTLQFSVRKLLFAEKREQTISEVRTFLDEKIAAGAHCVAGLVHS